MAFIGTQWKRPTYEQLSSIQWLLGFLRIREEERDPIVKENMISYLTELSQDACDYSWEAAKGAHSVLLHRMADGVVTWDNLKEVHKIRKRFAQTTGHQGHTDRSRNLNPVPCTQYNKGNCSQQGEHEFKGLLLKHCCQHCHQQTGRFERHSRKECWKLTKETSKNL